MTIPRSPPPSLLLFYFSLPPSPLTLPLHPLPQHLCLLLQRFLLLLRPLAVLLGRLDVFQELRQSLRDGVDDAFRAVRLFRVREVGEGFAEGEEIGAILGRVEMGVDSGGWCRCVVFAEGCAKMRSVRCLEYMEDRGGRTYDCVFTSQKSSVLSKVFEASAGRAIVDIFE